LLLSRRSGGRPTEQARPGHTSPHLTARSRGRSTASNDTEAPAWDRDAPFAGPAPHVVLLAALRCLASGRLEWLSGDAQAAAGMAIKVACKPHQESQE
tara:strand:+ start:10943 stop:11236 length:294 start_codon:yes stop_codon:yes gene_type:complete